MTKWERQQKREKAKRKTAAIQRRRDLNAAVKLLAALVPGMKSYTTLQKQRQAIVSKCVDVLAGEAAQS